MCRLLGSVLVVALLASASPCMADPFYESFDSYAAGSQMHGQGGWKGWDNDPAAGALVSNAQSFSSPNSVAIAGNSDLVHEWSGLDTGRYLLKAKQYIPSTSTGTTYFILLNQYNDGGPYQWSVQLPFNLGAGTVNDDLPTPSPTLPLLKDQWVDIAALVDFDANNVKVYYGGTLLSDHTWYGVPLGLRAIDLYANGAGPVFYDDLSIRQVPEPATALLGAIALLGLILAAWRRHG